ncbi:hypothetical protein [Mycobacterium sp. Z3061]|uniref:hypothetical protein n=1 Tax=Mycobacterium sp. Z3061 TaxID=3073562 RepID=UPI0028737E62|nr:hypothetical protein [Mycobacterium sp. Z3061]
MASTTLPPYFAAARFAKVWYFVMIAEILDIFTADASVEISMDSISLLPSSASAVRSC